jgi:hypothetical protein
MIPFDVLCLFCNDSHSECSIEFQISSSTVLGSDPPKNIPKIVRSSHQFSNSSESDAQTKYSRGDSVALAIFCWTNDYFRSCLPTS